MTRSSHLAEGYPEGTELVTLLDSEVPWHFGSVEKEYEVLRSRAGLTDLASAALIEVHGEATAFLQKVLARDVEYLRPERAMLSLLLDDDGRPLDLVTLSSMEDGYLVETSFGRGSETFKYLEAEAPPGVSVVDLKSSHSIIGVEGPYAWNAMGRLVGNELTALPYETIVETEMEGEPVLFSRTGFTGEYGYKVIGTNEVVRRAWEHVQNEVPPVGFGALETAMLEVRQPLLHREVGDDGVLECGFNWLVDFTKEDFRGRDAVMAAFEKGGWRRTVGFCADRVPGAGAEVRAGDVVVGHVVHAVESVSLGKAVGLARLNEDYAATTLEFTVVDDGRSVTVLTISSPYVVPKSWGVPIF